MWRVFYFDTSGSTTIIVPCVAHLYDINTDEHLRLSLQVLNLL